MLTPRKGKVVQNDQDQLEVKLLKSRCTELLLKWQRCKKSDLRYLEVEEKRLSFEESMLEIEDRRQRENREREIEQKREDREFQLKIHVIKLTQYCNDFLYFFTGSTVDVWQ